ncbi:GTPase-activating protein for RHO1, putative [Candida dubliniensis CD36]|uniref:GTPase-activating protein for RHO1, putative n=1 Tax=Candida dubliniensis (strain CD36 / ATCC MYA-646 / CBS 7987 / NCPF 3949 / NRRL Y-17841) TaxID=573826 RepID=B9WJN4_CANDC|nr:GTPase-activating protein for RHO1, putative [Candida dubliniensis CD36]CAX40581.1 GTPase-activating protein for RHO1, putative [Candida dubliniensis CD36]
MSSPNTGKSLFNTFTRNLKMVLSNESLPHVSDNENDSKSPLSTSPPQNIPIPQNPSLFHNPHQPSTPSGNSYLNAVHSGISRVRSNSLNPSETSVRQQNVYFGVTLDNALEQGFAKISILGTDNNPDGLNYGKIPIVVAKCGVYLKKNGLTVEGIFRVGGSSKRLKELQIIFNTPPDFGKKLNWEGYTVHDAATILRRYLNALPEPLIPLDMYEVFRDPLRNRSRIINYMKYKAAVATSSISSPNPHTARANGNSSNSYFPDMSQPLTEANIGKLNHDIAPRKNSESSSNVFSQSAPMPLSEEEINTKSKKKSKSYKKLTNDIHEAIDEYKLLVNELPLASKQLLFYILDLLSMVQAQSKENLMNSRNLAAIFQPSILSHPNHDMDPVEYALSQAVVEFLIKYSYKLLPTTVSAPESTSPAIKSPIAATTIPAREESDVTSTSTTPLNEESHLSKENYPHRESVTSEPHDSLVAGFQHNVTGSIPFDSDIESDIGSDLDDLNFQQLKLNDGSPIKSSSTPPSALEIQSAPQMPAAIVVSPPSSSSVHQSDK